MEDSLSLQYSEEEISEIQNQNVETAKRIRLYLLGTASLGFYTALIALYLFVKASGSFELVTFLNDHNGSTERITPYRNPDVTDRQAMHWARDKASELLSLSFNSYADQIRRRKQYFVGDGWMKYQLSLIENKVTETLREEGLIITAINQDTPRLLQSYSLNGNKNWRIEMPILQTIQGASDTPKTVKKIVSITVEQTRRDEAIEGLKIRVFGVIQ
ncbi:DotI/IcmL family type IV secretion protein [Teredinibacter purpureus]|uniref:DotI/IcmL family type IV secretion protein n=1 Tax=Teredinibacter purpureus TaxID=2731756 RepID=UPI0005F8331C|nr:DotI/IcmL family type IV secretion protein [Teredinibacter purpureus]